MSVFFPRRWGNAALPPPSGGFRSIFKRQIGGLGSPAIALTPINATLFITEQDDRILASVHRNSYIPNPPEHGHYTSGPPRPWLRRFDRVDN